MVWPTVIEGYDRHVEPFSRAVERLNSRTGLWTQLSWRHRAGHIWTYMKASFQRSQLFDTAAIGTSILRLIYIKQLKSLISGKCSLEDLLTLCYRWYASGLWHLAQRMLVLEACACVVHDQMCAITRMKPVWLQSHTCPIWCDEIDFALCIRRFAWCVDTFIKLYDNDVRQASGRQVKWVCHWNWFQRSFPFSC